MIKKTFSFLVLVSVNVSLFAGVSLSLIAMPLVGAINLEKTHVLNFTVINNNVMPIEAKAEIVDLKKNSSFQKDQFNSKKNFEISKNIVSSPHVFLIQPHSAQQVRVFVTKVPKMAGDYYFGIKFAPTKNLGQNAPATKKKGISVPIYLGQLTAVYVQNGNGKPIVSISCRQKKDKSLNLTINNTSPWVFKPSYSIVSGKKVLVSKTAALPVLGLSTAERVLSLKNIKDTSVPLGVTWGTKDGQSGHVECQK